MAPPIMTDRKAESYIRPVLLQIERYTEDPSYSSDDVPHKDEAQVGLDTNRSFVAYPTGMLMPNLVLIPGV